MNNRTWVRPGQDVSSIGQILVNVKPKPTHLTNQARLNRPFINYTGILAIVEQIFITILQALAIQFALRFSIGIT